jgi:hypothetical protein
MDLQVKPAGDDPNLTAEYPALSVWARRQVPVRAWRPALVPLRVPEMTALRMAAPRKAASRMTVL